jgi:hypothetical protein
MNKTGIFIIIILSLILNQCDCGGGGTTQVGNPSESTSTTVTAGKLDGDDTTVQVSLAVVGDEDDIEDTSFNINVNDTEYATDLAAADYYNSETETFDIPLTGISEGDVIQIIILKADGTFEKYEMTASITSEATGTLTDSGDQSELEEEEEEEEEETDVETAADEIVEAACEQILDCLDSSSLFGQIFCEVVLLDVEGMANQFGIDSSSSISTMNELSDAVNATTVTVTEANKTQCLTDIAAVSCDDVSNSIDTDDLSDLSGVVDLIPTDAGSCPDVFTEI